MCVVIATIRITITVSLVRACVQPCSNAGAVHLCTTIWCRRGPPSASACARRSRGCVAGATRIRDNLPPHPAVAAVAPQPMGPTACFSSRRKEVLQYSINSSAGGDHGDLLGVKPTTLSRMFCSAARTAGELAGRAEAIGLVPGVHGRRLNC